MNKFFMVQITVFTLIAASLGGMFVYTDIYEEVESGVVSVLCLSCIKLRPKTSLDYTFNTANGDNHPSFVVENLSYGPVVLHYSGASCSGCEEMFPTFQDYFDLNIGKEEKFYQRFKIHNQTVTYIYIYLDNHSIPKKQLNSKDIYDKEKLEAIPMFTFITKEYHHSGEIKPYYATIYGEFKENKNERLRFLDNIIKENIKTYKRNTPK